MRTQSRLFLTISAVLVAITLLTGLWLGHAGRPYSTGLLALHKLSGVGSVLFAVLFVIGLWKGGVSALILGLVVLAAAAVVGLIASGGIMSAGNPLPLWKALHIAATVLFLLGGGGAILLLLSGLRS